MKDELHFEQRVTGGRECVCVCVCVWGGGGGGFSRETAVLRR